MIGHKDSLKNYDLMIFWEYSPNDKLVPGIIQLYAETPKSADIITSFWVSAKSCIIPGWITLTGIIQLYAETPWNAEIISSKSCIIPGHSYYLELYNFLPSFLNMAVVPPVTVVIFGKKLYDSSLEYLAGIIQLFAYFKKVTLLNRWMLFPVSSFVFYRDA